MSNSPNVEQPLTWDADQHSFLLFNKDTVEPGDVKGLTEKAIKALLTETEGIFELAADQEIAKISDPAIQEAVGLRRQACPVCRCTSDKSAVMWLRCRGKNSGFEVLRPFPCYCTYYQRYYSRWANPRYVAKGDRSCTFENLLNGSLKYRFRKLDNLFYESILATVRRFPYHNYLMAGDGGVGKTTLMLALFDQALRAWAQRSYERNLATPAVWRVTALQLAHEHTAWAMRSNRKDDDPVINPPTVTRESVMNAVSEPNNFHAHVSIDEFDKYKMLSDFQTQEFHALIDACNSSTGQVVCNSNKDIRNLMRTLGPQYAVPLTRRLVGLPRGIYLDFWKSMVYVNNVKHILRNGVMVPVEGEELDSRFVSEAGTPGTEPLRVESKLEAAERTKADKPVETYTPPKAPKPEATQTTATARGFVSPQRVAVRLGGPRQGTKHLQ